MQLFKRFFKNEEGQAVSEAAILLPFFILAIGACIQFGWVIFSESMLGYAISQTEWTITVEEAEAATDKDALIKETIMDSAFAIDEDRLTVTNTVITVNAPEVTNQSIQDPTAEFSRYSTKRQDMDIEADVTYTVPLIAPFPMLKDFEVIMHIDKQNVVFTQFEVY